MASPDTRAHLLAVGRAMAQRQGLRALTVRGLAAEAGVNPGSFVYHFGTRDAFVAELIEDWYAPLYERLAATGAATGAPRERLAALVTQLVDFLIEQRAFVLHVIADAAAGEAGAARFMRSLAARHPALLLAAIRDAQADGSLRAGEPLRLMVFVLMAVGAPLLVFTALGRAAVLPPDFARGMTALAGDREAALERLDWALQGLAPAQEKAGARARPAVAPARRAAATGGAERAQRTPADRGRSR